MIFNAHCGRQTSSSNQQQNGNSVMLTCLSQLDLLDSGNLLPLDGVIAVLGQ